MGSVIVGGGARASGTVNARGRNALGMVDRERLCNDLTNTSVISALVGGFALSSLQMFSEHENKPTLDLIIYVLTVFSVHACTCATLTSAVLYRVVNALDDDRLVEWAKEKRWLLLLPIMKFGMGCFVYLASVVMLSYRDLDEEGQEGARWAAVVIGLMSMSSVVMVVCMIGPELAAANVQRASFGIPAVKHSPGSIRM